MEQDELKRFDRTLALLILLQSRKLVRAGDLAERFGVSLRTIYRDVRTLQAAGVPIIGEAGQGYTIQDGYRLPPVMFTREEAGSFVAAEKLMQKYTDEGLGKYFQSAISKIRAVLRGSDKDWISVLDTQVVAFPKMNLFGASVPNALELLFGGIVERRQIYLEYKAFGTSVVTSRHVEPVGVFHEQDYWYIMAYCHLRQSYRQFRTDRITRIRITEAPFTRDHPELDELRKCDGDATSVHVILRVDKEAARYLGEGRKYFGFRSERDLGDQIEMEFLTPAPGEALARWFLMFGDCGRIVSPDSFREQVKQLTDKIRSNLSL